MDRREMENRYGELGSGASAIVVRDTRHTLRDVLAKWTLDLPDILTVDGGSLGADRHWIRFYDREDRRYVVFEFDGNFNLLEEHRADSLAWEGEDFFRQHTG
jgi:hypothetical protein